MGSIISFAYAMISVVIISVISLIGIVFFSVGSKKLKNFLLYFVSFAAGALLGDTFIHLIPELLKKNEFHLSVSL